MNLKVRLSHTTQEPARSTQVLRAVVAWELKRMAANRRNWGMVGVAFVFFLALVWLKHRWNLREADFPLVSTTTIGLLYELIFVLLLVFGMFLPFVTTDAVSRDYWLRIHEMVMTTPVTTWAYVLGRYVTGLIISVGFALVLLVALLLASFGLVATGAVQPNLNLSVALQLWALLVLPATVFIGSLSFAFGTLFPRLTNMIKLAVLIGWIFMALDLDPRGVNTWRTYWNPTGAGIAKVVVPHMVQRYQQAVQQTTDSTQHARIALDVQQHMPDLTPWVGPFLTLVVFGIVLSVLTALSFRRFRDVLN